jgi:poly-gamma-glutamate synthesis protein (capsule biosynthesis protein)
MIQAVRKLFVIIFFYNLLSMASAQVSFCAVGDILLDRNVRLEIEKNGIHYPFEKTKEFISQHDIAFFNLECPLADSTDGFPINKKHSFRGDTSYIKAIKEAGFTIASVANNHTIDYGKNALLQTIENLQQNEIFAVGGGKNQKAAFAPLLFEIKGESFAVFAVLEFLLEGTTFTENTAYPAFAQINRLCDSIEKYQDKVDHILVSFHWGVENAKIPHSRQKEYAHKVIDAGADLVIGHHPHILQGIEVYKEKIILYSLGNFIFDNTGKLHNQSAIFSCVFQDGQLKNPQLIPVKIINTRPEIADEKTQNNIFSYLDTLSSAFKTSLLKEKNSIKIPQSTQKPIKELQLNGFSFYCYSQEICCYTPENQRIMHSFPDSNYYFIDADIFFQQDVFYLYSILQEKEEKSRIAVFPFSLTSNSFLLPSIDVHDDLFPKKIALCDLDKDSNPELIVMANKTTRYFQEKENRIFVYNVDKAYFYPKWLGSRIGHSILDFSVDKQNKRLILLQKSPQDNRLTVQSYKWNGFGFDYDAFLYYFEDGDRYNNPFFPFE